MRPTGVEASRLQHAGTLRYSREVRPSIVAMRPAWARAGRRGQGRTALPVAPMGEDHRGMTSPDLPPPGMVTVPLDPLAPPTPALAVAAALAGQAGLAVEVVAV